MAGNASMPVWQAKWIDPELPHDTETRQPASYLRKRFFAGDPAGVRPDGTVHDSLNHYSYGAVCGWLMGGVCGIQLEAGKLTIRPYPHPSLGNAEAKWLSPVGRIHSGWRYMNDRLHFEITVPVPAEIILPDGSKYNVKAGEYNYEVSL